MSELTKEWLQQTITELEEERDAVPGAVNEDAARALAAMKIALASLEAEPVAYIFKHPAGRLFWSLTDESNKGQSDVMPVYTTQPVPVFVPDELTREEYKRRFMEDDDFDDTFRGGWNACRTAMLQGAEPVSNRDELPLDYLHGHKDGLEWAAQLAEANHPQTGDWLYDDPVELAKAIRKGPDMPESAGNSPVIPDGWVACSERMPEGMTDVHTSNGHDVGEGWWDGDTWQTQHDYYSVPGEVTHWQPLPSPPFK